MTTTGGEPKIMFLCHGWGVASLEFCEGEPFDDVDAELEDMEQTAKLSFDLEKMEMTISVPKHGKKGCRVAILLKPLRVGKDLPDSVLVKLVDTESATEFTTVAQIVGKYSYPYDASYTGVF